MPQFSVIIPALNEAGQLTECIASVYNAAKTEVEIIVADGGSQDHTVQVARSFASQVFQAERGRGQQCNAGATEAAGEILLFLHADSRLPENAFDVLTREFRNSEVRIGTFRLSFEPSHWILRCYEPFSMFDSVFTRFGDQCITIRKTFFARLGGFPNWPLFEDVGLLQIARRHTKVYSFPTRVTTSSRRYFKNGLIRQQLKNLWLMLQYLNGVPPEKLAERYYRR